jgi:hypothetical protein
MLFNNFYYLYIYIYIYIIQDDQKAKNNSFTTVFITFSRVLFDDITNIYVWR